MYCSLQKISSSEKFLGLYYTYLLIFNVLPVLGAVSPFPLGLELELNLELGCPFPHKNPLGAGAQFLELNLP